MRVSEGEPSPLGSKVQVNLPCQTESNLHCLFLHQKFQCPAGQTCKVQYVPCVMPKCKDAIAVNRPTCIKDPEGTLAMLGTLGCGRGRTGC